MKKPLVSVILPVYNVEKYLEECFLSVKNQTYKNIEIIIVDDGATDGSGKLADDLAKTDKRATVIHKKNGGLSDARNVGIERAAGEYITFVDSDDFIDLQFIESLVAVSNKTEVDIVQCDNSRDTAAIGLGSGVTRHLSGSEGFLELICFKTISPTAWGKLYKTALFKDNDIEFPVGRLHEDTAVVYKLIYLAKNIACLDKMLYYYRLNESSIMTASYTKKHYDSVLLYHLELDEFIAQHDLNVRDSIIFKHKALRLLSVLNKMALNKQSRSADYTAIRTQYKTLTLETRSLSCVLGLAAVYMPQSFLIIRKATPTVRRILGKV